MSWQSNRFAAQRKMKPSPSNSKRISLDPFFALSLDPMWIATLDGHFRRVNPAFVEILGHPEPHLLSSGILDMVHPADRAATAAAIAGIAHGHSV